MTHHAITESDTEWGEHLTDAELGEEIGVEHDPDGTGRPRSSPAP